ncbi:hypothetical protein PanWU01x14_097620, partial [Parasponia andersonii]
IEKAQKETYIASLADSSTSSTRARSSSPSYSSKFGETATKSSPLSCPSLAFSGVTSCFGFRKKGIIVGICPAV